MAAGARARRLARRARGIAAARARAAEVDEAATIIATDASVLRGRGALAWAADDGREAARPAPAEAVAAELAAIAAALGEGEAGRALRVRSDSLAGLDALRRARSQGRMPAEPGIRAALEAALAALAAAEERAAPAAVRLEHVRGHRGDPLNERAHALAFGLARRLAGEDASGAASGSASPPGAAESGPRIRG